MLRFRSLTSKLIALYLPLISVSLIALLSIVEIRHFRNQQSEQNNQLKQRISIHKTALTRSIWRYDIEAIGQLLRTLMIDPNVQGGIVYDAPGDVLAETGEVDLESAEPDTIIDTPLNYENEFHSEPAGRLVLVLKKRGFDQQLTEHLAVDGLIFAVLVTITLAITLLVQRKLIITPIRRLQTAIEGTSEAEIPLRNDSDPRDELDQLLLAYSQMGAKQAAAEEELRNYKLRLEDLVSERNEELQSHQRLLHAIADNSKALIEVKSADGKYLMVNPAWCALFNLESRNVIGKTDQEIFPAEIAHRRRESSIRVLSAGRAVSEQETLFLDGVEHTLIAEIFPLVDRFGTGYATCSIATDVTDRIKLERELNLAEASAEQAHRIANEYPENVGKEVLAPLNATIGLIALALKSELTEKQRYLLNKVRIHVDSLKTLISNYSDFSRIQAGKIEIEIEAFDLYELLDDLGYRFAESAANKNLELIVHKSPEVPVSVLGDPLRLRQILSNLIDNAIKFTMRGEVVLSVRRAEHDPNGRTLHFVVQDTGIGIPTEMTTKLLSLSAVHDGSTNHPFETAGRGLVICRQLVALMNGTIGLHSTPGQGSSFWCEIPLDPVNVPEERADPARPRFRANKFLAVDDNPMGLKVLQEMLEEFGFECLTATNGEQALEILGKQPPEARVDAVFLDWKLPGIDGVETSRRIRSLESISDCPIVMVSACEHDFEHPASAEVGLNAFLLKPIRRSTLFDILIRLFSERRQPASNSPETPAHSGADSAILKPSNEDNSAQLEPIAGLDLREGIARLGNRPDVHTRLMQTFIESATNTGELIRSQFSSGNLHEVYRLLHTLNSIAGNLAATRLLGATRQLEEMTRARMAGTPTSPEAERYCLDNFLTVLDETLREVRRHAPAGNPDRTAAAGSSDQRLPDKSAKDTARRIRDATFMGDLSELHSIAESLPPDSYWALEIFRLTENLDFDGLEKLAYALDNLYGTDSSASVPTEFNKP